MKHEFLALYIREKKNNTGGRGVQFAIIEKQDSGHLYREGKREREGGEKVGGRDNRDSTNAAPRIFVDIEL